MKKNIFISLLLIVTALIGGCFSSGDSDTTSQDLIDYKVKCDIPSIQGVFDISKDESKIVSVDGDNRIRIFDFVTKKSICI